MRRTRGKQTLDAADHIVPRKAHPLSKTDVNSNALKVLNRLNSAGFQAYLVGGSVRDLLLGKVPKDFDVATDATPADIKHLFRNARIIGKRFKLVHIFFYRDIIEVATFRGNHEEENDPSINAQGMLLRDNVYGTFEQDAWRRDFTVNSLYYNINDASIIDLTGGLDDINHQIIRMIGSAEKRYQEDPVRMLRAIRFSAKLQFTIAPDTAEPIARLGHLLHHIPSTRLFEEITKLYQCGQAQIVQQLLLSHQLFKQLFVKTHALYSSEYPVDTFIQLALENTDTRIRENKPITPAFLYAVILWFPLIEHTKNLQLQGNIPPLAALEQAMNDVILAQNQIIAIPKRFTQVMKEIWLLQYRFDRRFGNRAHNLLSHPRFRAAYDFLTLRALANDVEMALVDWWTTFQVALPTVQEEMVSTLLVAAKKTRFNKKPNKKNTLP